MSNPLSPESPLSWPGLAGTILLQAVSGTQSIFSAYSASLTNQFSISQAQLNYLMVALHTGKVMGWFSSMAAKHLPLSMILIIGILFGSVGYGMQYLCTTNIIHCTSYWKLFLLNVLAGNSSCWINTYCELLTIRRSKDHNALSALIASYSGLSGKIYTSLVEGIQGRKGSRDPSTYMLLSCTAPALVGLAVALLISCPKLTKNGKMDSFPLVLFSAFIAGVYSIFESTMPPFKNLSPQLRALLLLFVIILPLIIPLLMTLHWFSFGKNNPHVMPDASSIASNLQHSKQIEMRIEGKKGNDNEKTALNAGEGVELEVEVERGNELQLKELLMSVNFWLYFWVNASGSTLAMVYLNNLGLISASRGTDGGSFLLAMSSAFGFFGRLLCIILDYYTRGRPTVSRSAAIMTMMMPMPACFFMLISESDISLYVSTATLGACCGALTATTATTTSELFGPKNSRENYYIVLTNIPIGSLFFGYLAALNYNRSGGGKYGTCSGFECHRQTFIIWGSICSVGTILSCVLHFRTKRLHKW